MDEMEQQVWQRIHAGPGAQGRLELRPLMALSAENMGVYRGMLDGKHREKVRRLLEWEQANFRAMRGMCRLCGSDPGSWTPGRGKNPGRRGLEGCYRRAKQLLAEYMARSAEPEFGTVFRCLAQRQEEILARGV